MARPTPFSAFPAALLVLIITLASAALGRPGRVVGPDGKTIEGDVTEKGEEVEIVSGGQRYRFKKAALRGPVQYDDSIQVQPPPGRTPPRGQQPGQQPGQPPQGGMSPEDEYQKRRAALAPGDVNGRIRLARWAFDRQEYDLARDAVQEALAIDPRNQEASALLRTIDAQRKLNRRTPAEPQGPGGRTPGNPGAAPQGGPAGQPADNQNAQDPAMRQTPPARGGEARREGNGLVPPLSPDEVNRVRLLEWNGSRNVRVRLLNDVKRRYVARNNIDPAAFNRLDAVEQAWQMLENGSPELLNDIRLTNDPPSMQTYRTQVQRAVLSGCATAACHGGGAGSDRFALHPRADQDGEAYANFITLTKYRYTPEKGLDARMIDRTRPEDSLLVQFGLPRDIANFPHPDVEGFRPPFRGGNDPKYRTIVRWITDSLSPLREEYGVPFEQDDTAARQAAGQGPQQRGVEGNAAGEAPPARSDSEPGQQAPPDRGPPNRAPPQRPPAPGQ